LRIAVDVMGGDNAPLELVRGVVMAAAEYNAEIVMVGDTAEINRVAIENEIDISGIDTVHTDVKIEMDDFAMDVVHAKKDSSMSVGLRMLREGECDAFVSAGNSGALHVGSSLIVRKIKGVHRAGIATVLPLARPILLMDSGANIEVTPDYLVQWAMMGSVYMKKIYGIKAPAAGLINNGVEETKGTQLMKDTYKLLRDSDLNFVGNIEAREIPFAPCDVLVTDGFTGNVVLKLIEGMGSFMFGELKAMFMANTVTKVAALAMKDQAKAMKRKFDASEHGGAPFLGVAKPVIKAHGSSDARAIKNAIRQAIDYSKTGVIYDIANNIAVEAENKKAKSAEFSE